MSDLIFNLAAPDERTECLVDPSHPADLRGSGRIAGQHRPSERADATYGRAGERV
jgi:hypothetical protein